jgi:16S rRNA (cytosine967-C5)-methyltransferase
VLRKVTARDLEAWIGEIVSGVTDPTEIAALTHSHPQWIVRALRQALVAHGRDAGEIDALLAADNAAPLVHLVALPGLAGIDDVLAQGAQPGRLAPASAYYSGGDVSRLTGIAAGAVRVQDTGSQLVARALAAVPVEKGAGRGASGGADVGSEPGSGEQWLDLCAGPGGKSALLAALGQGAGVHLTAVEPVLHRAQLVRQALRVLPEKSWTVRVADGRELGAEQPDTYHRVLVDAPCTGLGALRRRPESRWRRRPADLVSLAPLQRELLGSALDAVAPGGVVAYVTCSPHHAETEAVVEDCLRKREGFEVLDAGTALDAVSVGGRLEAGHGLGAQLWPHVHGTDAMYLALIRKRP